LQNREERFNLMLMRSVVDQIKEGMPEVEPWADDQEIVESTLAQHAGEWVVAAAYLDYANLTAVSLPVQRSALEGVHGEALKRPALEFWRRVQNKEELLGRVDDEARVIATMVPHDQREAAALLANDFLTDTAGHMAVVTFLDTLREPSLN
jgi:hypothetical protein